MNLKNIKQIIIDFVKETLEQYKEAMFATGLKRRGTVDLDDDLVRCDFVLPDLIRWGSYKSFGLRYYTFEAKNQYTLRQRVGHINIGHMQ